MKKYTLTLLLILSFLLPLRSQERVERSICNSTVEFVINTNKFIENDNYEVFITKTIPFIREHAGEIENILLVGSSSPEGNAQANIRLANRRADRIYSYISEWIPRSKIIVNNDYQLFLSKTGVDESDYPRLRATYIEIHNKKITVSPKIDTIYKEKTTETHNIIYKDKVDTVYKEIEKPVIVEKIVREKDTVYIDKPVERVCGRLVFSPYNNLVTDLIKAPGIGLEFYFHQMSFFVEGNFANTTLSGKKFTYDLWHTGFRKYFNDDYDRVFIEIYGRTGYFDMDIFGEEPGKFGVPFGVGLGLGWKFSLCSHVKLYPLVRFGYDYIKFIDYYYTETGVGNIGVMFNQYTDYKDNTPEENNSSVIEYSPENRVINKEFFEKAKTLHWFGPSYVGLVIQLDLHSRK